MNLASVKGLLGPCSLWKEQHCPPIFPRSSLGLAPGFLLLAGMNLPSCEGSQAEMTAGLLLWPPHHLILANCKIYILNLKKMENVGLFLWQGLRCCSQQQLSGEGSSGISVGLTSKAFLWSSFYFFQADKKDSQGNNTVSGFEILLQKQLKGKQMQKEMAEFVRER